MEIQVTQEIQEQTEAQVLPVIQEILETQAQMDLVDLEDMLEDQVLPVIQELPVAVAAVAEVEDQYLMLSIV